VNDGFACSAGSSETSDDDAACEPAAESSPPRMYEKR